MHAVRKAESVYFLDTCQKKKTLASFHVENEKATFDRFVSKDLEEAVCNENLRCIKHIAFSHCKIESKVLFDFFWRCPKLLRISLIESKVILSNNPGEIIQVVIDGYGDCVQTIELCDTKISKTIFYDLLAKCPNLEQLQCFRSKIISSFGDEHYVRPIELKKLNSVIMPKVEMDDAVIVSICQSAENLQQLDLSFCATLSSDGLFMACDYLTNLTKLSLKNTTITDNDLLEICKKNESLTFLNLSFCTKLSSNCIRESLFRCNFLESIILTGTSLEDWDLVKICKKFKSVKVLGLGFCTCLTQEVFFTLSTLEELEDLDLRNTSVEDQALRQIADTCKKLKIIDVLGCKNVTVYGERFLRQNKIEQFTQQVEDEKEIGVCALW